MEKNTGKVREFCLSGKVVTILESDVPWNSFPVAHPGFPTGEVSSQFNLFLYEKPENCIILYKLYL